MAQLPGAFKKVQGLGTPLAIYPLRNVFFARIGGLFLTAACLLGGIAIAGLAGLDAYDRYYHHGPAVVWRGLALPLVAALLLGMVGVWIFVGTVRRWPKALVLYEQGLAMRDPDGLVAMVWGDIASLRISLTQRAFLGIPFGTSKRVILAQRNGTRLSFDEDIRDADNALEKIRSRLLPILYEQFEPEFTKGQTIVFGPVKLHKDQGMILKQKTLTWQALQKASIERGCLELLAGETNGKMKTLSIPVAEIPNLDLLMAFIRQIKLAF